MSNNDFITEVLAVYARADIYDGLFWKVKDRQVELFAMCSDLFWWATADLEPILPEDVPLLWSCLDDLLDVGDSAEVYLSELYAARKRGMRPQQPYYRKEFDSVEGLPALFDKCGPERNRKDEG